MVLVHVVDDADGGDSEARARGAVVLDRTVSRLPLPHDVVRRVELGDPAERILAAADDERAELIVTGTKPGRQRSKALFGSVASRVIEQSRVPVVVVPPAALRDALRGQPANSREIVIGVDGSARADEAVAVASRLAQRARANVVLAHVVSVASPAVMPAAPIAPPISDPTPEHGRQLLEEARALVPMPDDVDLELRHGLVDEQLEQLARERNSDLLVVGSSRPGRFRRLLLGSTANRLAVDGERPIMIVPEGAGTTRHGAAEDAELARG